MRWIGNTATVIALVASWTAQISHASSATPAPSVAVAPQYDTSHVYVPPEALDRFVESFIATFGGKASPKAQVTITPTPSNTLWRAITTPVGTLSVFGFTSSIPYPFGQERTGYLVSDMDAAVKAARTAGASLVVAPFADPIGRDAIVQWSGGVNMQLYWHTTAPNSPPLQTIPENRIYLPLDSADIFIRDFIAFSHGAIVSDTEHAPGVEVGRPGEYYRCVRIKSVFGKMAVLVTDGHLPFPYGRETTGYEVAGLQETLAKAKAAGATILVEPYAAGGRSAAFVQFPGGYIAEIHTPGR
jgi:hypothetical protein